MILFLHRKDLRVNDLPAFDYILARRKPSLHVLILDPHLLQQDRYLEHSGINFLQHAARLQELYRAAGRQLHMLYGNPAEVVRGLMQSHPVEELVFHEDHTPYATQRDRQLREVAQAAGVAVTSFDELGLADLRDFQRWTGRSEPYKVFTPFYRKWSEYLLRFYRPASPVHLRELAAADLAPGAAAAHSLPPELAAALSGHAAAIAHAGGPGAASAADPLRVLSGFLAERLPGYAAGRDRYAQDATSRLSRHVNVGALSVRGVYEMLLEHEQRETWLRQLAWRDFYLYQARLDPDFYCYEKRYDLSTLDQRHFQAWCEARTGIPVIDAAMTELNTTGWMPNRLRMITAMFLTKNLLCPFPYGEQYFRCKLSDYDNTLNRGGWLWCASLGFDAAPYFRIMNPVTQSESHDPEAAYIRQWLPELANLSDKEIHKPRPGSIVDLKLSRARAIEVYQSISRNQ
ncbi:cryptochrome/photolyase family protein [Paenibacillus radicis (ex Xue et al. 2023)]|uniref:DNA photolyase family protein n=1 Tax=Paenibacillus radicis (ex Xue et al. 2023) TaxID=2972489 RepID=A0ABT1YSL0_9BACL|nr:deoxyribodipyrimidine photo-lyase [Paenibacillus radicis (ex Xue et al. 2023)]MCR8636174.1 DNA photolyase family protein [Paenibacillus radicis (ex Xue et al. 2023)]